MIAKNRLHSQVSSCRGSIASRCCCLTVVLSNVMCMASRCFRISGRSCNYVNVLKISEANYYDSAKDSHTEKCHFAQMSDSVEQSSTDELPLPNLFVYFRTCSNSRWKFLNGGSNAWTLGFGDALYMKFGIDQRPWAESKGFRSGP